MWKVNQLQVGSSLAHRDRKDNEEIKPKAKDLSAEFKGSTKETTEKQQEVINNHVMTIDELQKFLDQINESIEDSEKDCADINSSFINDSFINDRYTVSSNINVMPQPVLQDSLPPFPLIGL
jgi:uncharacterized protein YPO0396